MRDLDAHLGAALREALASGDGPQIAGVLDAMKGEPVEPDPVGDWSCRWIKMGNGVPVVVYAAFRCRIGVAEGDWRIEKLTGSQRFEGTLEEQGGKVVFTGVGFVNGEPGADYAGLPPDDQTPVEPNQTVAMAGIFEQTGPNAARLMLPDPILESRFDIIHLTR